MYESTYVCVFVCVRVLSLYVYVCCAHFVMFSNVLYLLFLTMSLYSSKYSKGQLFYMAEDHHVEKLDPYDEIACLYYINIPYINGITSPKDLAYPAT